jgi:acyl-CoA thioesterase
MTSFLGLEQTGERHWRASVDQQLITPGKLLYGGCGLAVCVRAMELAAGRPLRWATGQFSSGAGPGEVLDIEVELVAVGRNVTQARARAVVGGREVLLAMGALGLEGHSEGQFLEMPEVREPLDCPRRESPRAVADSLFAILEIRLATGLGWKELDGTRGSPDSSFWIRLPGLLEPDAATLSIFGDGVANGILQVTGRPMLGRSLDNTIRIGRLVPGEWVLVDVHMHAYEEGFTQGLAHLWAQDGTLLATASQTQTIKLLPEEEGRFHWGGRPPVD